MFEDNSPGVSQFAFEQRHPFFDVRLLRFLLPRAADAVVRGQTTATPEPMR